jgi:homoserine O-succinyltransferase
VIYLQGHPEYYTNSLLKEYRRDLMLHLQSDAEQPPFPDHYLPEEAQTLVIAYIDAARQALREGVALPPFPKMKSFHCWITLGMIRASRSSITGLAWFTNSTNVDRRKLFMDGIDPQDPLGIR